MKVKLSVLNRLSILGLLSNKGDLTTMKVMRELREELSMTDEEHALLKFRPAAGNKMTWDETAVPPKEFEFTGVREIILGEVKTQLIAMEEKKELLLDYLPLYETLIEKIDSQDAKLPIEDVAPTGPVLVEKEE